MGSQSFHRGIRDLKIAPWLAANSYGTAYDVLGARNMSVEFVVDTDELRGDDVVLDRYTKLVSANISVEHAALDLEAADIMMGGTLVSDAGYEDWMIGENDEPPYVALAARVVASGGTRDLHLFVPKAKWSGNITLQAQLGTYMIPAATFQAVYEGTVNGIARVRKFSAATALAIPLRTATGGF